MGRPSPCCETTVYIYAMGEIWFQYSELEQKRSLHKYDAFLSQSAPVETHGQDSVENRGGAMGVWEEPMHPAARSHTLAPSCNTWGLYFGNWSKKRALVRLWVLSAHAWDLWIAFLRCSCEVPFLYAKETLLVALLCQRLASQGNFCRLFCWEPQ